MSQTLALFRFLILAVTIAGGLHGIVVTFPLFFREESQGLLVGLLLVFMLTGYAYVTVAGLVFCGMPTAFDHYSGRRLFRFHGFRFPDSFTNSPLV